MNLACIQTEPGRYVVTLSYPGHSTPIGIIDRESPRDWRVTHLWTDAPTPRAYYSTKRAAESAILSHMLRAARQHDPHARRLTDDEITTRAAEILAERHAPGQAFTSPTDTRRYLQHRVADEPSEVFGAIWLDNRHRILSDEVLFTGTIDGASVYPRTIAQRALKVNAAACIVYHNHPSGDPTPSAADRALTTRLRDALSLIDVRLLDHVVVGTEGTVSFSERGWL